MLYSFRILNPSPSDWQRIESCFDTTCFHSAAWADYTRRIGRNTFVAEVFENNMHIGYFVGVKVWMGITMIAAPMDGIGTYSQGLCFFEPVPADKRVAVYQDFAYWLFRDHIASYLQVDDWTLRFDTGNQEWVPYEEVRIPALDMAGIPYTTRATIHLPLTGKTEEQLWAGLHYKSAKYSVNKANKLGLTVKRITDRQDIERFTKVHFEQVTEVCARKGTVPKPSQQRERMQAVCEALFPDRILMLEVHGNDDEGQDQIMATAIWTLDKGECAFWTAASFQRYMRYCPNELMIWTAIKTMAAEGCGDLNFCGMADYKLKYGGHYAYIPHIIFTKYPWFNTIKNKAKTLYFALRRYRQNRRGKHDFK